MPAPERISAALARRIALAAQGLAGTPAAGPPTRQRMLRTIDRLGLLQIDSVSVLVRSHYLPLFSRLGNYPVAALDKAMQARPKALFEYWGHEASLLPVATQPLIRWRMARAAEGKGIYAGLARFGASHRGFIEEVHAEVAARGPLGAGDLAQAGTRGSAWWGWSDGKRALEWLFWAGRLTTGGRRNFERLYDLPERALPASVVAAPTPSADAAQRALLMIAMRALGVATEPDLRDYFRLAPAESQPRLAELVEAGAVIPVTVEGWRHPAYLHPEARLPRRVAGEALLSPFDSMIWERARTERLFGFRYRLEIYTPAEKRTFGYYVLPFLLGDRIVARVDLKTRRAEACLEVRAAHLEPGNRLDKVAPALRNHLRALADWLALERLSVTGGGELAAALLR